MDAMEVPPGESGRLHGEPGEAGAAEADLGVPGEAGTGPGDRGEAEPWVSMAVGTSVITTLLTSPVLASILRTIP